MAYARRTSRNRAAPRRGYSRAAAPRRKSGTRRSAGRSAGRSGGTMKLVIEVAPQSQVSRLNPSQVAGALPKKAKF